MPTLWPVIDGIIQRSEKRKKFNPSCVSKMDKKMPFCFGQGINRTKYHREGLIIPISFFLCKT